MPSTTDVPREADRMPSEKNADSSAIVYVNGPVRFWLDGELVVFEMPSGTKIVSGVMSASNFIESFGRAAEVAHQWSSHHLSGNGFGFQSEVSPPNSSDAVRSRTYGPSAQ